MKIKSGTSNKSVLTIIILFVVAILIFIGSRENSITVTNESVIISGMYGLLIENEDIDLVELRENIPRIITKINAIDIPFLKKGIFRMEEFERARLFIHSTSGPFLIIISNSDTIIMSFKDSDHTLDIFNAINAVLPSNGS